MVVSRAKPETEPITTEAAKARLGIRTADNRLNATISKLAIAARERCESIARIAIPKQVVTLEFNRDETSAALLYLQPGPVIGTITSLEFWDVVGAQWTTIAATEYELVSPKTGRVEAIEGGWSSLIERDNRGLRAIYDAGYTSTTIPGDVLEAMFVVLVGMFEGIPETPSVRMLLSGVQSLRMTPIR